MIYKYVKLKKIRRTIFFKKLRRYVIILQFCLFVSWRDTQYGSVDLHRRLGLACVGAPERCSLVLGFSGAPKNDFVAHGRCATESSPLK
jgi:hypothetical protein